MTTLPEITLAGYAMLESIKGELIAAGKIDAPEPVTPAAKKERARYYGGHRNGQHVIKLAPGEMRMTDWCNREATRLGLSPYTIRRRIQDGNATGPTTRIAFGGVRVVTVEGEAA